jgi:hypothetical protein
MRVTFVVIAVVVLAAAALAAQAEQPMVARALVGEPTAMVLSGAALLAAGSALKRAA